MPVTLLWRIAPYVAALLAVVAGVVWLDHRLAAKYELANAQANLRAEQLARVTESAMAIAVDKVNTRTGEALSSIDVENRTIIQPTLRKELQREVRYTDPDFGITDVVWQALNRGIERTGAAPATGSIEVTLPPVEPLGGQDAGDFSTGKQ